MPLWLQLVLLPLGALAGIGLALVFAALLGLVRRLWEK